MIPRVLHVVQCRIDGAAARMSHHDNQRYLKLQRGKFNAANLRRRDYIASYAYDEEIAWALIKDNLNGHTGVRAAQDDGDWILISIIFGALPRFWAG